MPSGQKEEQQKKKSELYLCQHTRKCCPDRTHMNNTHASLYRLLSSRVLSEDMPAFFRLSQSVPLVRQHTGAMETAGLEQPVSQQHHPIQRILHKALRLIYCL